MNSAATNLSARWTHCRRWSFMVGIVASVAICVGGLFDTAQFFRAYLSAYLFIFGLSAGSLALLMIYHLTGGAWGFLVRRFLERAVSTMPLLAVGFVPVALGTASLYPFAQPEVIATNKLVAFQHGYMNVPFFQMRAAVYFALWLLLGLTFLRWSRREDETGDRRIARWCENLSGPGLVIYGVTMHFASIDWLLSLQPAFHSTVFGPVVASSQILSSHALALLMLAISGKSRPLAERVSPKALNDLGNLLFAFLFVWAYLCWVQFMLIWIGNLPVDVVWYIPRMRGGWQAVTYGLVLFGFAVPFVALLWRSAKQRLRSIVAITSLIFLTQLVFNIYEISPAFNATGFGGHWMVCVAPVALGGIWLAAFLRRPIDRSLLPLHDANEASAIRLRLSDEREAAWEEVFARG